LTRTTKEAQTDVWVKTANNADDDILTVCAQSDSSCVTPLVPTNASGVHLGGNYATVSALFGTTSGSGNRSKMQQSGASITVTLGALASGTVTTGPGAGTKTLVWNPSASALDNDGNKPCSTTALSLTSFTAFWAQRRRQAHSNRACLTQRAERVQRRSSQTQLEVQVGARRGAGRAHEADA